MLRRKFFGWLLVGGGVITSAKAASWAEAAPATPSGLALNIHSATDKTTIISTDEIAIADSESSFSLKKLSIANLFKSPGLTGIPTCPTASVGTNTNQVASTAFVLANAGSGGGGSFQNSQTFNSSGSWTVPAGITSVFVFLANGGGGGAGGGTGYTIGGAGSTGGLSSFNGSPFMYTIASGGPGYNAVSPAPPGVGSNGAENGSSGAIATTNVICLGGIGGKGVANNGNNGFQNIANASIMTSSGGGGGGTNFTSLIQTVTAGQVIPIVIGSGGPGGLGVITGGNGGSGAKGKAILYW